MLALDAFCQNLRRDRHSTLWSACNSLNDIIR
jgi:hypothetical protein